MNFIDIIFPLALCFASGINSCFDDWVVSHTNVIPVALMRKQADSIVIADVRSGMPHPHVDGVVYKMITKKLIYGGVGDEFCVLGPSGVKIGSHYLIFIRNNEYIDGEGVVLSVILGGVFLMRLR